MSGTANRSGHVENRGKLKREDALSVRAATPVKTTPPGEIAWKFATPAG